MFDFVSMIHLNVLPLSTLDFRMRSNVMENLTEKCGQLIVMTIYYQ